MLRVTMLPARHGDAILLEYGTSRSRHRVLIDAGPANAYEQVRAGLLSALKSARHLDLFVVTHIDSDHIDGAILLLRDIGLGITMDDLWFNGWKHLGSQREDIYAPQQGEFLAALIPPTQPWNRTFSDGPVRTPEEGPLAVHELPGDAMLTFLSPMDRQLRRLRRNWESVVIDAGLNPGDAVAALDRLNQRRDYVPPARVESFGDEGIGGDNSVANASSIAFVFEHDGKRALFTGDAWASVLAANLRRYAPDSAKIAFDLVKLPHHGSKANWDSDLAALIDCPVYLVSTNGDRFHHPDQETIELIAKGRPGPTFYFNYLSTTTEPFGDRARQSQLDYKAIYPTGGSGAGIVVEA